jgi:hypothetical protein
MNTLPITASAALALTLASLLFANQSGVAAQSPQSQPLVQAGDVVHIGVITAPNGAGLGGGVNGMAVEGNRWYYGCAAAGVAVLTLPPLGGTAQVISPCAWFPKTDQVHPTNREVITGGVLPWLGRIVTSGWIYYDQSGGAVRSHWTGADVASLIGPYQVGTDRAGMVGGYMGVIPQEWRALLGGPALTGQCCIPTVFRSSYGPSVSVFNPAHLGAPQILSPGDAGPPTSVPSTMLIGYPVEHQNLGAWDANPPNTYYGGTDQLGSVSFPAGTRSILFTGRHGDSWCYGPGTANWALVGTINPNVSPYPYCYDPTDPFQGNHGPPYRPTMWAYDANDVIAVKQGTKNPWDVQPYAKWTLPGMPIDGATNLLRAGYYDHSTRRLYVGSTDSMTVHVFEITNAVAQGPVTGPTSLTADVSARGVTFSWAPPDGGRVSHYRLEAGTSPGLWNVGTLPISAGATNLTLAAPGAGTFYLRLRAVYADGTDPASNEIQVVLGAVRGPAPPSNFRATAAGSVVTLAWDPVVDASVSDVIADVGSRPGLSNVARGVSIGKSGTFVAANVPPGHYYLRARSVNATGAGAPTRDIEVVVRGGI